MTDFSSLTDEQLNRMDKHVLITIIKGLQLQLNTITCISVSFWITVMFPWTTTRLSVPSTLSLSAVRTGSMWIPSVVPRPVPSCTVWWRPPKPTVSGFMIIWSMYSQNWLPIRMTPIVLSSQIFFPGPKWFRRSAAS